MALDFTEIAPAHVGNLRDTFEMFAEQFLKQEGFVILRGVDRGADHGRDLIVRETRPGPGGTTEIRWLVSCKHKAHSGTSVSIADESNVRDRLDQHECRGFIGFYSTVTSSGLAERLHTLKEMYEVLIYNPASIENRLLSGPAFRALAARYMPNSFNKWIVASEFAELRPSSDPQRIRNRFFLREPHREWAEAIEEAHARNLPLFIVVYDHDHPTHSKINWALGYFMEYHTTKKLVDTHFIPVVGRLQQPEFADFVPEDDPLELVRLIVRDERGEIILSEGVYGNPDEGMKRVRELIRRLEARRNIGK